MVCRASLDNCPRSQVKRTRSYFPCIYCPELRPEDSQCQAALEIPFPILIDTMDDRTATRWAAWPIRLFVVNTTGTVIYAGKPGPWGFDPGGGFKAEGHDKLRPHPERFSQESLEDFLRNYK